MGVNKKRIAILGSTGSIGTQALEVIKCQSDRLKLVVLTAFNNADLLIAQALAFRPKLVVIGREELYSQVRDALSGYGISVGAGELALANAAAHPEVDVVLTAMVGYAGLLPTVRAIEEGKDIALANKETLVVAGQLISRLANEKGVKLLPVDSEHSAIFQCLIGEEHNPIEKIILTASGGPFRGKDQEFLRTATREQALKHPNWSMGAKITIDSASLMNKGLEVIEAKWLFGLEADQIEVVVHPQSIIHSLVQFEDGSLKAQLGLPDMKLPIQYALSYPERFRNNFPRFSFLQYPNLTFEAPDYTNFRCLSLAFEALRQGGNRPCVLNAANEVGVAAFLEGKIGFLELPELVESCMDRVAFIQEPSLDDYIQTDQEARRVALELQAAGLSRNF